MNNESSILGMGLMIPPVCRVISGYYDVCK